MTAPVHTDSPDEAGAIAFDTLTPTELNRPDLGVIALDSDGRVLSYSDAASTLSGVSADAAIGRHYFREVAPSTNVPGFHGRFLDAVRQGRDGESFEFVFGRKPHPLRAQIGLYRAAEPGRWWLVITPLAKIGAGKSREAVLAAIGRRVKSEPVDASLCEREPIHIPGSIQPNAVLIAADATTFEIVAYSANILEAVGPSDAPLDGRLLETVLPGDFCERLKAAIALDTVSDGRLLRRLVRMSGGDGARFHATAHTHLGRVVVELERAPGDPDDFSAATPPDIEAAIVRLRTAADLDEAARVAATEIRALTGYESVLVYRFDAEWNGEAIVESMIADWNRPLIGLRFPSSDIPAQARALYTKAKSRFVTDRDCVPVPLVASAGSGTQPIDLTFAQNRTLSPIHLEYQRNLGVDGSMSVSILVADRLWGLMIGHHRRPHYVAPETRAAATVVTDAFAMRVQEIEARDGWAEQQAHLGIEGRLVRRLTRSDDFVQVLTTGPTTMLDLFDATGAGIVSGDEVRLIGACPTEAEVRALGSWLKRTLPSGRLSFETNALGTVFAAAHAYADTASGLLATFVDPAREHLLLWFRPEVPVTVTWGGDPRKPVIAGAGAVAVLPRRSFERWVEDRSGFAAPFADWQAALAEQFAQTVEGVVLRQRRKIEGLTELLAEKEQLLKQKDLLTKEIDHRVKNSLQIVSGFMQMQRRQLSDPVARQAFADTSARVMSVARVHDSLYQTDSPQEVDLGNTLRSLCNDLASMAGNAHRIELTAEPGVMVPYSKAVALSLIATELVTNAFKYAAKPDKGARVSVTAAAHASGVRLTVSDDGEGLPKGWEQGRPQGTGLGMRMVRAMLDQIEARLEVENLPGARFTVHA